MKVKLLSVMVLCASFFFSNVNAQEAEHVVKLNVAALGFRNISLQYEKPFHEKMSAGLGVRIQIPRVLPSIVGGTEEGTGSIESRLTGYALTPEFRFYPGSKGAPKGFYIAPYLRYTNWKISTESTYIDANNVTQNYDLTGKFTGIGGGLMIGMQWLVGDKFSIDWWIMGGHYGTAKTTLKGKNEDGSWSLQEQADIAAELEAYNVPFGTTSYEVTSKDVEFNWHMPFLGLRPGLALGWAF